MNKTNHKAQAQAQRVANNEAQQIAAIKAAHEALSVLEAMSSKYEFQIVRNLQLSADIFQLKNALQREIQKI